MTSRGIRNNNPGNIRHSAVKWQGQAPDQTGDPDFVVFSAPEWGIRAICRIMLTYQNIEGLKTVGSMISRWAPPNENATGSYVDNVAKALGVNPAETIHVQLASVMGPLVEAIIHQENGCQPYSPVQIIRGLQLAGIGPTPPPSAAAQGQPLAA